MVEPLIGFSLKTVLRGCLGISYCLGVAIATPNAQAQSLNPSRRVPPRIAALAAQDRQSLTVVTTATTPAQTGLTVPSLWWTNEQFGDKRIENWIAYARQANLPSRVDLIVRRTSWNALSYYDRYALVNQFGTVASDHGYNLLVFDPDDTLLGAYTCNFEQVPPNSLSGVQDFQGRPVPDYIAAAGSKSSLTCQLWLDPQIRYQRLF